jgi:hypothetical protein
MNMYVTIVQGLTNNNLNEDGTEKRFRAFSEISGLFSRKPINATTVIPIKRTILI